MKAEAFNFSAFITDKGLRAGFTIRGTGYSAVCFTDEMAGRLELFTVRRKVYSHDSTFSTECQQ
mgnify:CR=1 FL=1